MPFTLHPFAAVRNGYVTRFIDDAGDVHKGEVALPVVADPDPEIGPDERLFGPDFEVLNDRVRAYGRAVAKEPEELLLDRIAKLDALIASLQKA